MSLQLERLTNKGKLKMFWGNQCYGEFEWADGVYMGDGEHICFDCLEHLPELDEEQQEPCE